MRPMTSSEAVQSSVANCEAYAEHSVEKPHACLIFIHVLREFYTIMVVIAKLFQVVVGQAPHSQLIREPRLRRWMTDKGCKKLSCLL